MMAELLTRGGWFLTAPGTDIDPDTGHGPEWGKAAPIALLIILLLGISVFLLIKSMNRHMAKVPVEFGSASDGTTPRTPTLDPADPAAGDVEPPDGSEGAATAHSDASVSGDERGA